MDDTIESIPKAMEKFLGCTGKMVKPSPDTVEALIGKVRKGKIATVSQLREKIAKDFNVETACPAATLKALQLISKKEDAKCFWRIVKAKGELISKFPRGAEGQAELLLSEGHKIDFSKKAPVVIDYESKLSTFA